MPRTPRTPSYRLHKPSGKAVVTLGGRDVYLGPHGSEESHANYRRLVAEWLANGSAPSAAPAHGLNRPEAVFPAAAAAEDKPITPEEAAKQVGKVVTVEMKVNAPRLTSPELSTSSTSHPFAQVCLPAGTNHCGGAGCLVTIPRQTIPR